MKKKICVLTSTRADYGLLKTIIRKLNRVEEFDIKLVVTGAHLSPEFGLTFREIEKDGLVIDKKIEILLSSDTSSSISKTMGLAMISFADYFENTSPNLLIVLGDRYETLSVVITAMNQQIPIAHIHGGEITEGAIDDAIRHSITKMSYLHFTSTEEHRLRVIQLGEHPDRVFNVGAVGVENIFNEKLLDKRELEIELKISLLKPYVMVTYHPVTLEINDTEERITTLLECCKNHIDLMFIFTKTNADSEGRIINHLIDKYTSECDNIISYTSLGTVKYLSLLKYSAFVMGNSSSGIIEAPSFGIPTVNIGDRQKGRIQASSIINCKPTKLGINKAIDLAISRDFIIKAKRSINPFGRGKTSDEIVKIIFKHLISGEINLKKEFFNQTV